MRGVRARAPGHTTVVAYLALFLALGGVGAYAASKIGSKEIKRGAIRAKHIRSDAVGAKQIVDGGIGAASSAPAAFSRRTSSWPSPRSARAGFR